MKHKGLFITLLIVGLVIVVPVATIYGCFCDTTATKVPTDTETIDTSAAIRKKLVHSLDDTKTTGRMSASFSEEELDTVLYQNYLTLPEDTRNYLTGVEVRIEEDGTYTFAFDVSAPLFRTHVELYAKAEDVVNEENPLEGYYVFHITDAKVGRVGGLASLAFSFAEKAITDQQIEDGLASSGLTMDVSLEEKKIVYTKKNLLSDMEKQMGANSSSDFGTAFVSTAIENNLLHIDFSSNSSLTLSLLLEKLQSNKDYTDPTRLLSNDILSYNQKLKKLLDSSIVPNDSTHPQEVMDYLLLGYVDSDDDTKAYIDTLDLSSIGITEKKLYPGVDRGEEKEISSILSKQFDAFTIGKKEIGRLTEEDFGYALLQSGVFGKNYLFIDEENGSYTVNSLVLDNLYCDITSQDLSLVVGASVNGYETSLILDTVPASDGALMQNLKIQLKIQSLYYGELTINDTMKNYLYQVLASSLEGSDWLTFDSSKGIFTFDLAPSLDKSLLGKLISDNSLIGATLVGEDRKADGYLSFTLLK